MNKQELFVEFLNNLQESASKDEKEILSLIETGFKETVSLMEGPYIWGNKQAETPKSKKMQSSAQSEEETEAQVSELARREKEARMAGGRLKGVMAQMLKAAKVAPLEIEDFINGKLKDAIKEGKAELDEKFGTDTSKKSFMSRLKGAAKAFTESEEGQSDKWATIISLDGEEAEEVYDIIDSEGETAGAKYLSGWDYGHESDENLSDQEPWGSRDWRSEETIDGIDYVMAGNKSLGYIALHRLAFAD
jgi:hypothetical protein